MWYTAAMTGGKTGAVPSEPIEMTHGELAPVRAEERIQILDVLRGFAMLGVLWSNLNDFYGTLAPSSSFQRGLAWTQDWLIESRFYSLLGFLFGIGFAIQLTRAVQHGSDVRAMFCRRMAALLGIGVVHGLMIWQGDVLTEYALIGFTLVLFRRLSPRRLLVAAASMLTIVPYIINAVIVGFGVKFPQAPVQQYVDSIYAHGSLTQIIAEGARGYLFWYRRWPLSTFPPFLALFLLGLWAVRLDLVKRLMESRKALVWVLAAAVGGSLISVYVTGHFPKWWPPLKSRPRLNDVLFHASGLRPIVLGLIRRLGTWSNACAYAAVLALLVSFPSCARRLEPLAAVGRMSLTTYLSQSLISVILFYHYGFGWYSHVGYDGMFAITMVIFALQIAGSVWWLRRFRFGPMEWFWRSIAYGKLQPFRGCATWRGQIITPDGAPSSRQTGDCADSIGAQ
jgi:uncharacterized protein